MSRLNDIKYTLEHRKAFRKVEKILFGKNTIASLFHDLEKPVLYFIFGDRKWIQVLHRKINRHHVEHYIDVNTITKFWLKQLIVDFECARLTKPDKPLNWIETIDKYYPQLKECNLEEILPKEKYYELKEKIENCLTETKK